MPSCFRLVPRSSERLKGVSTASESRLHHLRQRSRMMPEETVSGVAHNAALALLVASSAVALGGYVLGRRDYDRGNRIPRRAAAAGLTGAVGATVAVVLLAAGV